MKRGFSLVELLVVIAILGILASIMLGVFSGPRKQARDSRRISDLRLVQQALESYKMKCGQYPGDYDSVNSVCRGGNVSLNASLENPDSWSELQTALVNARIGIDSIPRNPGGVEYVYKVQLGNGINTGSAQCYVLMAELETEDRALEKDLDVDDLGNKLPPIPPTPGGCNDISCKNLFPSAPASFCADGPISKQYCVGNIDCFFGD